MFIRTYVVFPPCLNANEPIFSVVGCRVIRRHKYPVVNIVFCKSFRNGDVRFSNTILMDLYFVSAIVYNAGQITDNSLSVVNALKVNNDT